MKARYLWAPACLYFAIVVVRGLAAGWAEASSERELERGMTVQAGPPTPAGYVLRDVVSAKVTAYEPSSRSCGKFADGVTSIGRDAMRCDGVAVAPRAIPYGALVFIPGVGFRVADDTGAAMVNAWRREKRVHIDVRMSGVSECLDWGVKENVPVHVFVRAEGD